MTGRGRSALQGSETVHITEVTGLRVNNVAASWEWVWSFRSSCSKSRNYMQFSRQLHAPHSLLMGIETFVLSRQEARWGGGGGGGDMGGGGKAGGSELGPQSPPFFCNGF